jgi:hypothetical protein
MTLVYHYDNGTRSCANRIIYTHVQDTGLTFYLVSAQTAFTWYDGLYAHAQKDRGGADSCAFGRGGADSMTFDLKTKYGFLCLLKR